MSQHARRLRALRKVATPRGTIDLGRGKTTLYLIPVDLNQNYREFDDLMDQFGIPDYVRPSLPGDFDPPGKDQTRLQDPPADTEGLSIHVSPARNGDRVRAGVRVAPPADAARLGKVLHDYLRARARVEGVQFALTVDYFQQALAIGANPAFGVHHDGQTLLRDDQEPSPGYLATWLRANQD